MSEYRPLRYFSNEPPEKVRKAIIAKAKGSPSATEAHARMSSQGGKNANKARIEATRIEEAQKQGLTGDPLKDATARANERRMPELD